MKKVKLIFYCYFFIVLTISFINAETAYEFLKISPSPACSAMGDACISRYNNASSFYYNPAVLTLDLPEFTPVSSAFKTVDLYFSYIKYYWDMNYFSFFSVLDIKYIKRIGIGFTGLFYGDIDNTSYQEESYNKGNQLNLNSYSFLAGYGYDITKKIGIGINVKLPIENLGDQSSIGIGADIGGIYKNKDWNVSMVIQNIGIDIKKVEQTYQLPAVIKIGGSYIFYLFKKRYSKTHEIILSADIGKEIENDFTGSTGLQYGYHEMIFIRNGYVLNKDRIDIRLGGGLAYRNYQIDYAYNKQETGDLHRFGLGIKFNISGKDIEIKSVKQGTMIRISDENAVLFEYNKARIRKEAYLVLDKVIKILKAQKDKDIIISGHTDNTGEDKFNLQLSKKRAEAVYQYFIKKRINRKRMKITGHGETQPIADNKTEKGRAKNRRVEIILSRLNKEEKEKFDYHYYSGLDCYYKEGYNEAIQEWEKALNMDPENENIKEWINKAENEREKKEKKINP